MLSLLSQFVYCSEGSSPITAVMTWPVIVQCADVCSKSSDACIHTYKARKKSRNAVMQSVILAWVWQHLSNEDIKPILHSTNI